MRCEPCSFREALWRLAAGDAGWPDADRLQALAFSLLGVASGRRLIVLAPGGSDLAAIVRPGDLMVRSAPSQGVHYSSVVVSGRPEAREDLSARGVPVEGDGPGLYVEVAEAPFPRGAPRSVGRCLTDAAGRVPRGQTVLRAVEARREEALAEAPDDRGADSTANLSVMTWNIRLGLDSSLKAVADAVVAAGVPDVLALQEIGVDWHMAKERVDQPRVLAKQIGLAHHLFVGAITEKGGRFGIALLCRWPFAAADVTLLPLDKEEQRVLLRARVAAPKPFCVLNTHLSRNPPKERLAQAKVVGAAATATAADGPMVLLGDLNDNPGSDSVKAAGEKLVDCFAAAGKGPPETFSVKKPKDRIDYVFCGGGLAATGPARVVREALASDHFPVAAVVGPPPPSKPRPPARP